MNEAFEGTHKVLPSGTYNIASLCAFTFKGQPVELFFQNSFDGAHLVGVVIQAASAGEVQGL
jgi:hypothetical protein